MANLARSRVNSRDNNGSFRDSFRCIDIFFKKQRRNRQHIALVVESFANIVRRKIFRGIDIDANQDLATAFRVQSIPAVKVMKDGKLVDEFTGAAPREQLYEPLRPRLPHAPASPAKEQAEWVA